MKAYINDEIVLNFTEKDPWWLNKFKVFAKHYYLTINIKDDKIIIPQQKIALEEEDMYKLLYFIGEILWYDNEKVLMSDIAVKSDCFLLELTVR